MSVSLLSKFNIVLEQNLSDPNFSIHDFCKSLNISRSKLHRTITNAKGLSTSHYIRQLRLEQAKLLLETTDMLIYEVAEHVGFKNAAYFSTSFLATFGYSPKETKSRK